MIMGRDLLDTLGMDLLFSEHMMRWDNATVPMRNPSMFHPDKKETYFNEMFLIHDPLTTEAERIQRITDIKYSPADFDKICEESTVLTGPEKGQLKALLQKHKHLFDGTLGKWTGEQYDIELKPDAKPYHSKAYPVPHSQEVKLKAEVECLVKYKVLRKVNHSEWAAPSFTVVKKDGITLRSIEGTTPKTPPSL